MLTGVNTGSAGHIAAVVINPSRPGCCGVRGYCDRAARSCFVHADGDDDAGGGGEGGDHPDGGEQPEGVGDAPGQQGADGEAAVAP